MNIINLGLNKVINVFLPKNMTDLLQVLDLVVNAIFKQFTRKIVQK